jgi:pimeloyl-ACP methyl ester carboxylesterase
MSRAVQPWASTPRASLAAWRLLLSSAGAALARVLWTLLLRPAELGVALLAPLHLARFRRQPDTRPALESLSPGIWRAPRLPESPGAESPEGGPEALAEPLVVLQFTGTGESVHAAYENTRRMFEREPRLARASHYVFEAPLEKGAYYGPETYAASNWLRVEPIVAHYPGPFVLVGVSRGGLVALDHGARIAEEHHKVAGVLALSAPVAAPRRIPGVIAAIAGFVESLEGLLLSLPQIAPRVRRHIERHVQFFYLMLIALILRFHRVYSVASLERHALDVRDHGVINATLRAAREFRLLSRAGERKLQLHCQLINQALMQHRQRFFAALVWGAGDRWIDAETCRRRFAEAADKVGAEPPHGSVLCEQGHLVRADDAALEAALLPFFARVADEVCRLSRQDDPQAIAARRVENELHQASEARREDE